MERIKLEITEWEYDLKKQIGPAGGFGVVFAGSGGKYGAVAVKKLKIGAKEAAYRELKIAKELANRQFSHVMPVLDSGQDGQSDSYFVVMPRAEKSLQDELNNGKIFNHVDAANILLQIVNGLSEVPDIVHRDLKPGNVLYHEGKWKVADFGIARFVEESTSLHTVKDNLTPQYAAPEQWQYQRATSATDIYALGCIGFALLTGNPPFQGPGREQFGHQHLYNNPPTFSCDNPILESLLRMLLRKTPETRPDIDRVKRILTEISESDIENTSEVGLKALAQVGAEVASLEAEEEVKRKKAESEIAHRRSIAKGAVKMLMDITMSLFKKIRVSAPVAKRIVSGDINVLQLGQGELHVQPIYHRDDRLIAHEAFPRSKWDVVAAGIIGVKQRDPPYEWNASLWYSKIPADSNYRWREVSYFVNSIYGTGQGNEPFASPEISKADKAASPGLSAYQIAFGPKPIDDEDFDEFCNRWGELLAKATKGQLTHPRVLPLQ